MYSLSSTFMGGVLGSYFCDHNNNFVTSVTIQADVDAFKNEKLSSMLNGFEAWFAKERGICFVLLSLILFE